MVYKNKDGVILYAIRSLRLREIRNKVKKIISLGLGRDLERLQLTIGFIAARFIVLVGIIVKSIMATYKIIIILLKDLLSQ